MTGCRQKRGLSAQEKARSGYHETLGFSHKRGKQPPLAYQATAAQTGADVAGCRSSVGPSWGTGSVHAYVANLIQK
jgi:hypothetical protein